MFASGNTGFSRFFVFLLVFKFICNTCLSMHNNILQFYILSYLYKLFCYFLFKIDECFLLKIYQGWSFTPDDVPAIHYQKIHLQVQCKLYLIERSAYNNYSKVSYPGA